jgi:hypothetical protein
LAALWERVVHMKRSERAELKRQERERERPWREEWAELVDASVDFLVALDQVEASAYAAQQAQGVQALVDCSRRLRNLTDEMRLAWPDDDDEADDGSVS